MTVSSEDFSIVTYDFSIYEFSELQLHLMNNHLTYAPNFKSYDNIKCRSQWPRGLSHELSSLARRLGSWVRIPPKVWMSVLCAFILFVFFCL
jgi:hypothetical protein